MTEMLQEFFDSRGVAIHVDRPAAVIRGVKVLGLDSRNGRSYLPEAIRQAASLYEDAKVNVNHPKGNPSAARDYQDRIGVLRNVAVRPGEGLFADFHFNPKHALAEQLLWDAEHASENVGFSHNVEARTARRGDRVVVESITRVQSVDLVADPATTNGLFESAESSASDSASSQSSQPLLTLDDLKRDHPALVESIRKDAREEQAGELCRLREELEERKAADLARGKEQTARRLLQEHRLPQPESAEPLARMITSARFFESLLATPDEAAMRGLVEERANLVERLLGKGVSSGSGENPPRSREQQLVDRIGAMDAKCFVDSIT